MCNNYGNIWNMEILKEIRQVRTARQFEASKMEKETCDRILNAGRQAPSAKNRQAWRFISLQNEEMKKNIQAYCYHDERVSNAAAVILLCTTNIDYKMPNGQLSYPMDLAFAASYMTLQAQYEGWDSAILSTYQEEGIQQILSIPYSMRIPLILLLGKNPSKGNSVKKRFDKKRIISYDHW